MCWNAKSKTKCFKFTVKTQQQCINITILLCEPVPGLLDHIRANIKRYEVQSVVSYTVGSTVTYKVFYGLRMVLNNFYVLFVSNM